MRETSNHVIQISTRAPLWLRLQRGDLSTNIPRENKTLVTDCVFATPEQSTNNNKIIIIIIIMFVYYSCSQNATTGCNWRCHLANGYAIAIVTNLIASESHDKHLLM